MNKNLKKAIIIISMIFLIIISTSTMISANDVDSTNETNTADNIEVGTDSGNNEIYVDNNVDESGDGSENHPFKTIKEAISFGNDKNELVTINIHSGTYYEKEMKITTNMIIKSYDGDVTLDAKNRGWFLYSNNHENNLTLIGLIFKNGIRYDSEDSTEGGVVRCEGHIDVVNCTFENNYGGTGGGINSHNGANIINSTFKNNKAEYNGAGVYVLDGQTNIINCAFDNNLARRQGGAIRIQGSTYIENSTFTNNIASTTEGDGYTGFAGNGGAIRVTDGDLNIESSTFINNSAHFAGGAISAGDDSQYSDKHYQLNINNSTFDGNKAAFGAGIEANDGINLTNSVLSNNTVPNTVSAKHGQGSGVYVLNGDSILSGNTIKNNTNPSNRFCSDVYSYGGNVAQDGNDWGSDTTNRITTNNGETTTTINTQPTVKKPIINIQTGNTKNNQQTGEKQDTPNTQNNDNTNTNTNTNPIADENEQTQNSTQTENTNTETQITNTDITSEPVNNNINNYNPKNMIKTNTSTNNVKSNTQSNADIGETSKDIEGTEAASEASGDSSTAHEISAIKSITSNEQILPYTVFLIIIVLALIIGYKKKQSEY